MPLENLLAELEREAEAAIARTLGAARAEAARIAAASAERLERRRAEFTAARRAELAEDLGGALAAARRESRRRALAARERLLARVFAAAARRLDEVLRGEEYAAALPAAVAEALSYCGEREALLRVTPALAGRVRDAAAGAATLVADEAVGHGVRAETADGGLVVDATLEGLLARQRPLLAIEVLAHLDGAPPPHAEDARHGGRALRSEDQRSRPEGAPGPSAKRSLAPPGSSPDAAQDAPAAEAGAP